MKKPVTQWSDDELLKIVKENTNLETVYEWSNDVMDFISFYNLKSGEHAITTKLLYRLYSKWSKEPIDRRSFSNVLTDIFPSAKLGISVTILLDKDALKVSAEVHKYLEKFNKTKHKNWAKHFNAFLDHHNIKKGGLFITTIVLYNIYDKWIDKIRNYHPLGYKQFTKFCQLYFDQKKSYSVYWFGLDESIKNHLTEDLIQLNKKAARNAKKENKKKRS